MLPDVSTTSSYAKRSRTDGQYLACKINLLAISAVKWKVGMTSNITAMYVKRLNFLDKNNL